MITFEKKKSSANHDFNIGAIIGGCLGGAVLVIGILVYYQYSVKKEKPLTAIDAALGMCLAERMYACILLLTAIDAALGMCLAERMYACILLLTVIDAALGMYLAENGTKQFRVIRQD